jgi:hypothetical protein
MASLCAGAIVALALVVSIASLALAATSSFPDVPATHPYYEAITDLASRGVINGYPDGTFRPDNPVLRQHFAKMIVLSLGFPVSDADLCNFTDVEKSLPGSYVNPSDTDYPDHYVAVCAAHGITTGKTATTFDPYSSISRFQVISMVVRAIDNLYPGLLVTPPDSFTAAWNPAISPDHGQNARRAEYNDLLSGIDLTFLSPLADMPRGEIAQVLHNVLEKITPASTTTTTAPCP